MVTDCLLHLEYIPPDINECVILQPCVGICTNLPGTYNCSCPKGSRGDGKKDGNGCTPTKRFRSMDIVLGVSISFLLVLLGVSWLYWGLRERKISRRREKFFLENGGRLMLQKILSKHEGSIESARIFTDEELKKATDHYHESRILGQGGQGTVYRGILADTRLSPSRRPRFWTERNLSLYFASAIKGERLFEIINPMVLNEGNPEEIMEVAMLANQCLTVKGEDRPTMKEVAMELEGLMRVMDRHPWLNRSGDLEEAKDLLGERSSECDGILRSNASGNDDSIRNQVSFEIESGR
ncbi:hypothetical protein EUGRSUZ_L00926 [Eucalyptus grandis]|uniref:EGF-like domain-containing protein n=3 Tax=Eucalyptus grandis TaxID=71139 RepID=A0AAD9TC83_EUCGR|nr:hypothetical protein EUGRSUZ_L00926 [Eucalyptus grandis]